MDGNSDGACFLEPGGIAALGANRPLRLRLAASPALPAGVLIPQRIVGSEAVCGGIEYRVLCFSTQANVPLSALIALPAALDIVTDQGRLRSICSIVTQASAGDNDGALASYQLVLADAFTIMEKRINTRVFRRQTDIDIVKILLDEWIRSNTVLAHAFDYVFADFFDLQAYPQREFVMQHNESDAAFVRRLLKRSGVAWFFRAADGQGNIRAIAHHGKFLLQSQHDDTDINAGKNLKLTASDGKLTGMADEIVLISKHGAFIRIAEGITFGSKSPLLFNAPNFVFNDPQSMEVQLPSFSDGKTDQQFIFQYEGDDGQEPQLAPQAHFDVKLGDGSSASGRSDGAGKTDLLERAAMHLAGIEVFNNKD